MDSGQAFYGIGNFILSFISIMVKKVCYSQNSAYQQQSCCFQTEIIGASRSVEELKAVHIIG